MPNLYYTGRRGASREQWREYYDQRALAPDWLNAHAWCYSKLPELNTTVAAQTIVDIRAKLGLEPHHRVIDVGCGSGKVLNELLHPGQIGVGVEQSRGLIRRAGEFGVDTARIRFVRGHMAALPLATGRFDRVLCYSVFQCCNDYRYAREAVAELVRVCAPGGLVLIGDVFGFHERWRTTWRRRGLGLDVLRATLSLPAAAPLRLAIDPLRKLLSLRNPAWELDGDSAAAHLHFSHGFFRRIGRSLGCGVETLRQDIPGRTLSAFRFDVRIHKV
jgi:SAM-dependent methyltransferase